MALTEETAQPYVDAYVDEVLHAARTAHPPSASAGWSALRLALSSAEGAARIFVDAERAHERARAERGAPLSLVEACLRIFRRAIFERTCAALVRALDGGAERDAPGAGGSPSAGARALLVSMRAIRTRHAPLLTMAQLSAAARSALRVAFFTPGKTTDDQGDDVSAMVCGAWERLQPSWLRLRPSARAARGADTLALAAALPDEEALRAFWRELCVRASPPTNALFGERVNWDDLMAAARAAFTDATLDLLALPALFLRMRVDGHGRVAARSAHAYAARLSELLRTRLVLLRYESATHTADNDGADNDGDTTADHAADNDGAGGDGDEMAPGALGGPWVRESEVEAFVHDSLSSMPLLSGSPHLQQGHSFRPFYIAHATRYLLVDAAGSAAPAHAVPLRRLLVSSALSQFLAMRVSTPAATAAAAAPAAASADGSAATSGDDGDDDDDAAHERRMATAAKRLAAARAAASDPHARPSWFSLECAMRVYRTFLSLDTDHDGMLGLDELRAYGDGSATEVFLQRAFEVLPTYDAKLDYKGFLHYVLAHERPSDRLSFRFFFGALDLHGSGALGAWELRYFMRGVMAELDEAGDDTVEPDLVVQEIFELARVTDARIRFADLVRCGAGEMICAVLTDSQAFWRWDNRESLLQYEEDTPLQPLPADRRRLLAHADGARAPAPTDGTRRASDGAGSALDRLRARSPTLRLVELGVERYLAELRAKPRRRSFDDLATPQPDLATPQPDGARDGGLSPARGGDDGAPTTPLRETAPPPPVRAHGPRSPPSANASTASSAESDTAGSDGDGDGGGAGAGGARTAARAPPSAAKAGGAAGHGGTRRSQLSARPPAPLTPSPALSLDERLHLERAAAAPDGGPAQPVGGGERRPSLQLAQSSSPLPDNRLSRLTAWAVQSQSQSQSQSHAHSEGSSPVHSSPAHSPRRDSPPSARNAPPPPPPAFPPPPPPPAACVQRHSPPSAAPFAADERMAHGAAEQRAPARAHGAGAGAGAELSVSVGAGAGEVGVDDLLRWVAAFAFTERNGARFEAEALALGAEGRPPPRAPSHEQHLATILAELGALRHAVTPLTAILAR
ncbi:hypothetical protein KFE25_008358 [Diacronema lutheri]|uniref:Uncharacterized protein n=1 Tax=Diacronema lutheri TaxID=2081491 RepID=A0A8J5XNK7_DIALT|nr:hypothetical protein KFE25_008358 [Diacronema lutheri]